MVLVMVLVFMIYWCDDWVYGCVCWCVLLCLGCGWCWWCGCSGCLVFRLVSCYEFGFVCRVWFVVCFFVSVWLVVRLWWWVGCRLVCLGLDWVCCCDNVVCFDVGELGLGLVLLYVWYCFVVIGFVGVYWAGCFLVVCCSVLLCGWVCCYWGWLDWGLNIVIVSWFGESFVVIVSFYLGDVLAVSLVIIVCCVGGWCWDCLLVCGWGCCWYWWWFSGCCCCGFWGSWLVRWGWCCCLGVVWVRGLDIGGCFLWCGYCCNGIGYCFYVLVLWDVFVFVCFYLVCCWGWWLAGVCWMFLLIVLVYWVILCWLVCWCGWLFCLDWFG